MATTIYVPVPIGDLVDKITILRIKLRHIADPGKLDNVRRELQMLEAIFVASFPDVTSETDRLADDLYEVNEGLWSIEDEIREFERRRDFSDRFVSLARSVYVMNDRRATLKRDINVAFGSALIEEKSYASF